MEFFDTLFKAAGVISELQKRVGAEHPVHLKGVVGSLRAILLSELHREFQAPIFFVANDVATCESAHSDLTLLGGAEAVSYYPGTVLNRVGGSLASHSITGPRLSTVEALFRNEANVVVSHSAGLLRTLSSPSHFSRDHLPLQAGKGYDFDEVVAHLVALGFERMGRVEASGEMSVRGGIIDVFPHSCDDPVRVEFWGDEIESMRFFDPASQRSTATLTQIDIYPQLFDDEVTDEDDRASLLDYLPDDALLVLEEPDLIAKHLLGEQAGDEALESIRQEAWRRVESEATRFRQIRLVSIGSNYPELIDIKGKSQETLSGNLKLLRTTLDRWSAEGTDGSGTPPRVFFLCDSEHQAERFREIFTEEGIEHPNLTVQALALSGGFLFPPANTIVLTDHQFYGRPRRARSSKRRGAGLTPRQLRHLNRGDYVVHVDYGIGVYRGLKKVIVQGHERECLEIEYRHNDRVYVRIERMDRVYKYSSKEGAVPVIHKLGSPEWQKLKARTKKKVKDIANELIEIYAKRQAEDGFSFATDSLWQRELEVSFPYEDTPDQEKATADVKRDMESEHPMDRLICGDVGFGKTEIAVRAAFKAVLSGKQVAILVPTTVLAYQHFSTFRSRLEPFPVKIEMLSRFRSAAEQKEIATRLQDGKIDIVIGTHRLLSKDIQIPNLGLLVIDEEQRFGVTHKERLKKFRATVDVLTLTATPIPRTLQSALMGARDMTHIYTPPRDRQPIVTEILPFNRQYIREGILREMDRGGQVFFVHNRVRSIERVARMLEEMVPEARVAIAHGQMPERGLEKIMVDFTMKKYDILVCTMIIESGLDMPNVNTIIVNRADKLGLAQLYQLRGRVGRSHVRAFAYLLIPHIETLTGEALKRLRAIEEFSEIGSGARLAMRDLEIRGAGNMLGAEQSGFIDSLGFDLYNKVLGEAVGELKREKDLQPEQAEFEQETAVDIEADAYIPESYVPISSERVDIYRRLTDCRELAELEEVETELRDRNGRPPTAVSNLIAYVALRILGKRLGLSSIRIQDSELIARFAPETLKTGTEPFREWLGSMLGNAASEFEFVQDEGLGLRLQKDAVDGNSVVKARRFLESLLPTSRWQIDATESESKPEIFEKAQRK